MDKIERQKKHFNEIADVYYKARQTENHLLVKDLIWRDFLNDKRDLKRSGVTVLEAMCGFAEGKKLLEKHLGVSVIYSGSDYSDTVVERLRESHPGLDIHQQDITKFVPDKQNQYDIIILLGGLHHVPDMAADVVSRLSGAIRPGGYFINLEPTSGNWIFEKAREMIYKRNSLFDEQTERAFSVSELFNMFEAAELSLVDVMYPGLLAYVLYYNPDAFPGLNVGNATVVKMIQAVDRLFYRTLIGRWLSFATLTLWKKPAIDGAVRG